MPLNVPKLFYSEIVLIHVWLPGGAAIIFAQNWTFEQKLFLENHFMKKIESRGVRVHFFFSKMGQKARRLQWAFCESLAKNL